MRITIQLLLLISALFAAGGNAVLMAQMPQLPPLPGTEQGGGKPSRVPGSGQSTGGLSEAQINEMRLIGMAAAMKNLVLSALKDAVYVVRQEYYCLDDQGNKHYAPGKEYFGRRYGLAVAADGRLWSMSYVISPWLEDEGFKQVASSRKPVRSYSGLRRLDADRSFQPVPLVAFAEENRYIGYYEHPSPIRYAQSTESNRKTEGRLIMFYVNNGEDPESAEIQSTIFNVDPDWSAKGVIRNPIPDFRDKLLLGGLYVIEEPYEANDAKAGQFSSRGNSRGQQGGRGTAETGPVGAIQFKVAGLYHQQGNEQLILSLPTEDLRKADTQPASGRGDAGRSQRSSQRSSRSGRR